MENNNSSNVESAQNTQNNATETTAKVSLGSKIWAGTKKAAEVTAIGTLSVVYVAVNVAAIALPLAACVKYLRED